MMRAPCQAVRLPVAHLRVGLFRFADGGFTFGIQSDVECGAGKPYAFSGFVGPDMPAELRALADAIERM